MSIFKLLGLRKSATKDEVKTQYIKRLLLVHPDRNGGFRDKYLELRTEYERYTNGDLDENPYSICSKLEADSLVCRCGGGYSTFHEKLGRIECEYCSCFIELRDAPMSLPENGQNNERPQIKR